MLVIEAHLTDPRVGRHFRDSGITPVIDSDVAIRSRLGLAVRTRLVEQGRTFAEFDTYSVPSDSGQQPVPGRSAWLSRRMELCR
jgi:hypothetical protein